MRLHLIDYHLAACRVILAQLEDSDDSFSEFEIIENGETLKLNKEDIEARFQDHFNAAEKLINETGYHRRDEEIEEIEELKNINL